MALFIGTVVNKRDQKGRVSVPAHFRVTLATPEFNGMVVYPSFEHDALECASLAYMEQMARNIFDGRGKKSPKELNALTSGMFGQAAQLPFDGEGRVVLPQPLLDYGGIADQVAFVGRAHSFQIWNPERWTASAATARTWARENEVTPPLQWPPPAGPEGAA
jgi:MraZ protein